MVESRLVSGKVIERRGDVVITIQGGIISSYNLRYYTLPEEELTDLFVEEEAIQRISSQPVVLPKWTQQALSSPFERNGKKSVNRA